MKSKIFLSFAASLLIVQAHAQTPTNNPKSDQILLSNGWSLTPAGRSLQLGDLPLNMALSPSNKLLAVTNNGQSTQSIQLIDPKSEKILDEKPIAKAWYGLTFSANEKKLYVSGANDNIILIYPIISQKLGDADTIKLGEKWPNKISPTGIAVNDKAQILYTVTKENNSLYIVDLKSKKVLNQIELGSEAYDCLLSPDQKTLYISLWGADEVAIFDTQSKKIIAKIKTENRPNELCLNKKGTILFVANAGDNSVSIINTASKKVIEVISASISPTKLTGSTTNGLALSSDEETLFIANADNNCLAVFDVEHPGKSTSKGFIPTGWYPTNVKSFGKKIFVSNGKGFTSLPNPNGPKPISKTDDSGYQKSPTPNKEVEYIGGLFKGTLSIIDIPKEDQLEKYSKQVYGNVPARKPSQTINSIKDNPIPFKLVDKSPIKHVFYVIKENRTYDQVLGDIKKGNGQDSLCLFPENVTPNIHALANEFVLLDNFYVDAEVSADGHNWSTAAYANDYVEKSWPISYGGRGGTYDFEGSRKIAYPRDGFIWDYCKRAGLTYRTYGEFTDGKTGNIPSLENNFCPGYAGFDMSVKDTTRYHVWEKDFDQLLAQNSVPQFNTIRFSNDHTSGQRKGSYTPIAAVADNDLAVGLLVDRISHSAIWKESLIIVLEDDAQNGSDHVDAHRSPILVISPYTKRNEVISTMYSTSGALRTIELVLGLPPMSQYDAAALPFYDCFTPNINLKSFHHIETNINLNERNVAVNSSSKKSESFNLAKEDAVPDLELNEVIWKSIKGENSVMPAPRRSAFVILEKKKKDADD
ncbi:MAG: beta-propeller fold lactonase family protein [Bacteroidetes bacterium]|nr:beta-propeller fold lactonase family protein [Bacteroidota bacterium]MBU1485486.1 beta-propeller fold lactonase family protein [Bacteroidota bacterium]MBU2046527.1 beta-propeller fold lactonase family protein [Bacteroidota bacterium]MBU2268804.1 beta-propeller fold lactonase family protein [Bacteroidota bacterium]MBU2375174.1 beta-propeller fold lactonase family protein [Bacteroidota bacterium]